MSLAKLALIGSLLVLLSGCAARKYRPAPLSPALTTAAFDSRRLDSPGLQKYVERVIGRTRTSDTWDLPRLTLAAFYFNPEMEIARARVAAADAAVVTAGGRPNPTINGALGGETSPASPWLASLGLSFPIETAGKRHYRITAAEHVAEATRWQLAATAWSVRSQLRAALLEYISAGRTLNLLKNEQAIRAEQVSLLDERLAVGMIPRPEVDTARIQYAQTVLAVAAAQGRVSQAEAGLAAAIGLPANRLTGIKIVWQAFDQLPPATDFPLSHIKDAAVLNRIDIRQSLAAYAATEAKLQLEIAKQYPDIELGPGYEFNEGDHGFDIGFGATLPLLNRNQGPIAEAEAARKQAAAQFLSVQAAGVAASEQALAKYETALNELAQARQIAKQSAAQEQAAQQALHAGQGDRVALNGTQLQVSIAAIAEQDAVYRAQQALGLLEDAVQRPLEANDLKPLTPESPELTAASKAGGSK